MKQYQGFAAADFETSPWSRGTRAVHSPPIWAPKRQETLPIAAMIQSIFESPPKRNQCSRDRRTSDTNADFSHRVSYSILPPPQSRLRNRQFTIQPYVIFYMFMITYHFESTLLLFASNWIVVNCRNKIYCFNEMWLNEWRSVWIVFRDRHSKFFPRVLLLFPRIVGTAWHYCELGDTPMYSHKRGKDRHFQERTVKMTERLPRQFLLDSQSKKTQNQTLFCLLSTKNYKLCCHLI